MSTTDSRSMRCTPGLFTALAALAAGTAFADTPLPPSNFHYDVREGHHRLPDCTPHGGSADGGSCGSDTSGPGYAATSGGIGTPSYLPVTPGGTELGTGTAVDAESTAGPKWGYTHSFASMSYYFEASGPSSVEYIPIDVLSTGLTSISGRSSAYLSLSIWDEANDSQVLDLTARCSHGECTSSWGTPGELLTDALCVANGDDYLVKITAATSARGGGGKLSSASAVLDPVIKLDPPAPKSCPLDLPISEFSLRTSPGSSTGVPAPEPAPLTLAAAGALGLLLFGRRRRTVRQTRD
jgi:hypothetical protein